MGKVFQKTLQICLSKFKESKLYVVSNSKEDRPWSFSCAHPKTPSFSLERSSKSTENVYKSYNSLYVVSDVKSGVSQSLFPLPESDEEEEEVNEFGSNSLCKSTRFLITYDDKINCSDEKWVVEHDEKNWFLGDDFTSKSSSYSSDFSSDSSRSSELPPDLVTGLSYERFFFNPGRSKSILEETKCFHIEEEAATQRDKIDLPFCVEDHSESDLNNSSLDLMTDPPCFADNTVDMDVLSNYCESLTETDLDEVFQNESVAVLMYSPNPYMDFRTSMQEMVEAHNLTDWSCLQEMLLCYLSLNKQKTHKFILGAFADLLMNIIATTTPLLEYASCKDND
eukprot:Gb_34060 [translate_table: standard]